MGQTHCVTSVICPVNMLRKGWHYCFACELMKPCQFGQAEETKPPPHLGLWRLSSPEDCSSSLRAAAAVFARDRMTKGKCELTCAQDLPAILFSFLVVQRN